MSNCSTNTSSCTPCAPATVTLESVASQLQNQTQMLFGTVEKSIVNGRAVWTTPCQPESAAALCLGREDGEGLLCFLLRVINDYGLIFGGTYSASATYCKNTYVAYAGGAYVSLQNVPINQQPDISPAYWQIALSGIQGPQGDPGPPGSGAAASYAVVIKTGNYVLTNNDAVVVCQPSGLQGITIPLQSSLDAGKFYIIQTNGAFTTTITPTGPDTIAGAASITISTAGESLFFISDNAGNWTVL